MPGTAKNCNQELKVVCYFSSESNKKVVEQFKKQYIEMLAEYICEKLLIENNKENDYN